MRFAEKSFELRFCAALSAAIMPFNRNPLWIGMTQAQERANGIDALIRIGGNLHVFQFKAQHDSAFTLDKFQWRCLSRIGKRFPDSTYYVFPEAADIQSAAKARCLLNESWCVKSKAIGRAFIGPSKTSRLTLDAAAGVLKKARPKTEIKAEKACREFGCFCPTPCTAIVYFDRSSRHSDIIHFATAISPDDEEIPLIKPMKLAEQGIPLGHVDGADGIRTKQAFEDMLGKGAERDLAPGLFGLFIPAR